MKTEIIVVFDIGKTNKKILIFNNKLEVLSINEEKFPITLDDDGDECDNIELIERWIISTLQELVKSKEYNVQAVNFTTYGASLVFLDGSGNRIAPMYNYLKKIDNNVQSKLLEQYGGECEFCRKTASPSLDGMLNSGVQLLWLQMMKPNIFKKVKSVLHLPQYLSFLISKQIVSESTSIGCHTFMWDFDNQCYHQWITDLGISLPTPFPSYHKTDIEFCGNKIKIGIGIHDSSASLVPYLKGDRAPFILVSTGTWCINMNPFNNTILTNQELKQDCLSFLSIDQKPIKSSRFFLGYIHDENVRILSKYFNVEEDYYKEVKTNTILLNKYLRLGAKHKVFFRDNISKNYIDLSVDLSDFNNFDEAYHRFMYDLTRKCADSIDLVNNQPDLIKNIFISGGFARNEMFVRLLSLFYNNQKVYTSEMDNSSAMGAALMVSDDANTDINLGLKEWSFQNRPLKVSFV
ncbi:carbohydrate kinase [Halosquirtibacter laminarini]|uniref:Carbohydrate kinase n=1 Tax=Halosquirtibacter laminarini TaxID=3374600 RepID=A0AC61NED4_9BACT|nr:carbohydrate kinase [Prolixibacteraceae bacterium]